jgi:hypothetical protein
MPSPISTKPGSAFQAQSPAKPPKSPGVSSWVKLAAILVVAAQVVSVLLWISGQLRGPQRNLVPQALLGGAIILLALAAHVWRDHPESVPAARPRVALALLILIALAMVGIYALNLLPVLRMNYDLASWSESYFITPIIKWRAGTPLYTEPRDSNSSVYTFIAPILTYFIASVLRHPISIALYRVILQGYLVLAALFAAVASWRLVRLALPERWPNLSRAWIVFFALASFLISVNRTTNAFNIYLHVDGLGVLATTIAFWLMTEHATTRNPRWLWLMAVMPSVAFLVKQYLAIWAAVYVVYLWLDDSGKLRRALAFAATAFGLLGVVVAACLLHWGWPFRYWILEVMGQQVVSFSQMFDRLVDSAWCLLLGLLGGAMLLRGKATRTLLGIWVGWVIMVVAGNYTGGITFVPTHLGPATVVGGCFFLAALVKVWPDESNTADAAEQWFRAAVCIAVVVVVLSGLGYWAKQRLVLSADLARYTRAIDHEFDGLPPDRVLTDFGDWIYLRDNVVIKDRAAILPVHQDNRYIGMIDRLRNREYARILVRNINGFMPWDADGRTGVREALLANYREVRRVRGVRGMDQWLYRDMLLSDVSVMEPIAPGSTTASKQMAAPVAR